MALFRKNLVNSDVPLHVKPLVLVQTASIHGRNKMSSKQVILWICFVLVRPGQYLEPILSIGRLSGQPTHLMKMHI